MDITIFEITFISFNLILGFIWCKVIGAKKRMQGKEDALRVEQILPEGSDISHGMVITENGLEADEKPTLSWFSKLAG